jgi:hypothetical protein
MVLGLALRRGVTRAALGLTVVVVERAWSFGDDELDSISRVGQITRSVRLVA